MADNAPAAPSRAAKIAGGALAAIIAAAVAAVAPHTTQAEGDVPVGYRDPGGVVTAGIGHTGADVKLGVRYSDAQRQSWYAEDMTEAMQGVVRVTPAIAENKAALMAAGDLAFNGGLRAYSSGPMAPLFAQRKWVAGCNAFPGWWAAQTFGAPQPRYQCRPKKGAPGKWLCNLPGLIRRRLDEQRICLTGK